MKFILPWPPTVNTYYRTVMFGKVPRVLLSKKARQYSESVASLVATQEPMAGRLDITIELFAPTRRKYDIDNRVKAVLDSLEKASVFLDDEQIDVISVIRRNVSKGDGKAIVTLMEIEP